MINLTHLRTLEVSLDEVRHSERLMLPDGMILVPVPGYQDQAHNGMIFRPYYVSKLL